MGLHERPYEKLIVWKEAHALCLLVYDITKSFPSDERFRLVGQMCRSAYGVPMNIAEGNMKRSEKEKAHFFEIGIGSLEELHYQCRLAKDLHYIPETIFVDIEKQIHKTSYLLIKLRSSIIS